MSRIDQLVAISQFKDLVDLTGEDQAITSKDEFILTDRRDDLLIETDDLDDVSAFYLE